MKIYANGGWRTVSSAEVFTGGAWRVVNRMKAYASSAWRDAATFAPPLSATTDPSYGTVYVGGSPVGYGSGTTRAVPSGGLAPYTYLWSVSSSGGAVEPTLSSTNQAGVIVNSGAEANTPGFAQLLVTVTDAIGQTATAMADFTFTNIQGGF